MKAKQFHEHLLTTGPRVEVERTKGRVLFKVRDSISDVQWHGTRPKSVGTRLLSKDFLALSEDLVEQSSITKELFLRYIPAAKLLHGVKLINLCEATLVLLQNLFIHRSKS